MPKLIVSDRQSAIWFRSAINYP